MPVSRGRKPPDSDRARDSAMQVLGGPETTIYSLAFSSVGGRLVGGGKNGSLSIYDAAGGVEYHEPGGVKESPIKAVAVSPDGHLLAVATYRNVFGRRWSDPQYWGDLFGIRFPVLNLEPTSIAFLDDRTLVVGTGHRAKPVPGRLEIWDIAKGQCREPYFQEPAGVRAVATHPPSRTVAWANASRRVTVWDVTRSDQIHFNQAHNSVSLSLHPDGQLLAATADYDVRLYDIGKRHEVALLKGHKGRVTSVAFSPDGRTLATGSWDETIRIWDVATGRETTCFHWPIGKVFCLTYAPDGLRLAAGGDRGTIVVWDVE